MNPSELREEVRREALRLGFDGCGFTTADPPSSFHHFQEWLQQGAHGEMGYLARYPEKRAEPQRILPMARSVVVVAASYHSPRPWTSVAAPLPGQVARYARHSDYHDALGQKLEQLSRHLDACSGAQSRSLWYVDTGPILERDFAQRAGIGFVGKHTNVISRQGGNWLLLGEILTTAELPPDPPEKNRCGTCTRCMEACPTHALPAPFRLDARRCISYLTIELKGSIPVELRPLIGDRIFGCDDCLAACPWNRFAREGGLMRALRRSDLESPSLLDWLALDDDGFKALFRGTPMWRTKRRGLLRNVCVALGNVGGPEVLDALEKASRDPEPLIVEHALWAMERIRQRHGSASVD